MSRIVARVRRTAMRIAKTFDPEPDMLVVELTALFHDMAGTSPLPSSFVLSPLTLQSGSLTGTDILQMASPLL